MDCAVLVYDQPCTKKEETLTLPFGGAMTTGEAVCRTYLQPRIGAVKAWASSRSACAAQKFPRDIHSTNVRPSGVAKPKGAISIPKVVIINIARHSIKHFHRCRAG